MPSQTSTVSAGAEQEAPVLPQDQHPGLQESLRERAGGRDEPQGQVERGLRVCRRLEEALDETLAADLVLDLVEDVDTRPDRPGSGGTRTRQPPLRRSHPRRRRPGS